MSSRSYTVIWLHLIWGTYKRQKLLPNTELRKQLSNHLYDYSHDKGIYMKTNYIMPDHVHAIIDLPTDKSVEEVFQLLKGNTSTWVNHEMKSKFAWAKGYAAFSISQKNLDAAVNYVRNQKEHHRKKNFTEEYEDFIEKHNLVIKR